MPSGAWKSLHGGSRKWFPEQSADPSLIERVAVWWRGYRTRTRYMPAYRHARVTERGNPVGQIVAAEEPTGCLPSSGRWNPYRPGMQGPA